MIKSIFILCLSLLLIDNTFSKKESSKCKQNGITIDGTTYWLEPCSITDSMIKGKDNKPFAFTIMTTNPGGHYGFTVYGYGQGFPDYAILETGSGGARGNTVINEYFNNEVFSARTYEGYLPILIYPNMDFSRADSTNTLKLKIKLIVK
jgi:hypothetical protein